MPTKKVTVCVVVVLLLCAAIHSIRPTGLQIPVASSGKAHERVASASSNGSGVYALPEREQPGMTYPARASGARSNRYRSAAYEEFLRSRDLYETCIRLSADRANPEALYFAHEAMEHCLHFGAIGTESIRSKILRESAGDQAKLRLAALARLQGECSNFPANFWQAYLPAQILAESAAMGDTRSKSVLISRLEPKSAFLFMSAASEAQELIAAKDPHVIDNLAQYFDMRNQFARWRFPDIPGDISGGQIATAMRLAACEFGYDCGAEIRENAAGCARYGNCDATDRDSYFQRYTAMPGEYERIALLKALIVRGITSGQWPEGFWTGVVRK